MIIRQNTQTRRIATPAGVLARLRRDQRGNTLALVGAALLPITAMIGSGLDVSRAYVVKGRLQQACDSSALAVRRSMTATTVTSGDLAEGRKYFDFNFPSGTLETNSLTYAASRITGSNEILVNASVHMPNKVMNLFGFNQQEIAVSCKAAQGFVNNDIVMVLDTTGSMDETVSGTKKIVALRAALLSFYDALKPAQDALEAKGLRLRYGVVSYATHANVGKILYGMNTSYIRNPVRFRTTNAATPTTDITRTAAWYTGTWNGCVDERDTDPTFDSADGYTIPADAFDLQIDTIPTSADPRTQWRAQDAANMNGESGTTCTAPAQRLRAWTRSEMETYGNTLIPNGSTYHDVGLVWGGRMLSNAGVFADSPDDFNGYPTNRYLIFMTDGVLAPTTTVYSAYGVEKFDKRVTGSAGTGTQFDRHLHRYKVLCNAIKGKSISVWTIAFGTSLSTEMRDCASDPSQARTTANQTELIDAFKRIARSIGGLRLTQ